MKKYFWVALGFIILSCNKTEPSETPTIDQRIIKTHLEELSSDAYMGRMPFTEGGKKTTDYIAKSFKEMGVEPGNGDSYFQEVPMLEWEGEVRPNMIISNNKNEEIFNWKFNKDFIIHSERIEKEVNLKASELVFCGYGIVDKSKNWNDYQGIDMKGKTAVVLVNDPGFGGEDDTFFKGDIMTYFGRWTYKYEEADRQGADGLILIHETTSAGYPWFVIQSSWTGAMLGLEKDRSNDCGIKGWIHLDKAKELFEEAGLDLGKEIRNARKPGFKPKSLNLTVDASLKQKVKKDVSNNVVGIIKGSTRPEEYIIYTAHWDHMGIGPVVNGDSIYNGAMDNASGSSTVMAIANAMVKSNTPPERSVVFLMVTAEEQGLLGSAYYAENPIFPIEQTVCNLNMDGVNPYGKMKDFSITGIGHSEMDEIAEKAVKAQGRYVLPEQDPEKGYFFRSDHFNFAKVGVPCLYGDGKIDHWEKGKEYAKEQSDKFTAERYHQPSDEYDPQLWNFDGMIQDGQLFLNIGWELANNSVWPQWKKESEFSRKEVKEVK